MLAYFVGVLTFDIPDKRIIRQIERYASANEKGVEGGRGGGEGREKKREREGRADLLRCHEYRAHPPALPADMRASERSEVGLIARQIRATIIGKTGTN